MSESDYLPSSPLSVSVTKSNVMNGHGPSKKKGSSKALEDIYQKKSQVRWGCVASSLTPALVRAHFTPPRFLCWVCRKKWRNALGLRRGNWYESTKGILCTGPLQDFRRNYCQRRRSPFHFVEIFLPAYLKQDHKQRDANMDTIKIEIDTENNQIVVFNNGEGL